MIIRPAALADRGAIFTLLTQEMHRYPLKMDYDKTQQAIVEAISTKRHFAWVVEKDGGIGGLLIAFTGDNLWAQRMNCNIVAWISHVPCGGAALLRKFRDFVKSRRAIKVAGMAPDIEDMDDRVWDLARRIGFERRAGVLMLVN